MTERHIVTPEYDFEPPRVLFPLMTLPTIACPDCGRSSATGALHWPWCVQVPEPEREKVEPLVGRPWTPGRKWPP